MSLSGADKEIGLAGLLPFAGEYVCSVPGCGGFDPIQRSVAHCVPECSTTLWWRSTVNQAAECATERSHDSVCRDGRKPSENDQTLGGFLVCGTA